MAEDTEHAPVETFPISVHIQEELDWRAWSLVDLAERSGLGLDVVHLVMKSDHLIDDGIAAGLAQAFESSAEIWLTMDRAHRERAYFCVYCGTIVPSFQSPVICCADRELDKDALSLPAISGRVSAQP